MKNNKINIFLLVTSILSILILLIGATFSYFNISTMSRMNALVVESGQVKIGLGVSPIYSGHALIPLKDEYISKAYNQKCLDDLNRGSCLAFGLEVFNFSKAQEIEGTIDFYINGIENLSYMVLDENGETYLDTTHIDSSASSNLSLGQPFILDDATNVSKTSKKFILLIWLTDNNKIQDETDAEGSFYATVTFSSTYGGRLTGNVNGIKSGVQEVSQIN